MFCILMSSETEHMKPQLSDCWKETGTKACDPTGQGAAY